MYVILRKLGELLTSGEATPLDAWMPKIKQYPTYEAAKNEAELLALSSPMALIIFKAVAATSSVKNPSTTELPQ